MEVDGDRDKVCVCVCMVFGMQNWVDALTYLYSRARGEILMSSTLNML